ncbi:hypothetical protein [Chitinimonas taiwanensis]|uniref:hypothetical protein n=1 Tax=Chitinimonas taiwanensis TaxID=240412 RepID=UPI0035ADB7C8
MLAELQFFVVAESKGMGKTRKEPANFGLRCARKGVAPAADSGPLTQSAPLELP